MDIEKVYIIQLETLQHIVDGFQGLAFAVFVGPELAGYPDFLARDAAFLHCLSHTLLIIIGMCRVDVSVTGLQCRKTRLPTDFIRPLQESAQPEAGHLHAVVQCNQRHARRGGFLLCVHCTYAAANKQGGQQDFLNVFILI